MCNAERSFPTRSIPPLHCPICEDERQFVRRSGQEWTTLQRLAIDHRNRFEEEAPRLLGIGTEPEFAIGQRALLVQSPAGNLLWDCITLIDNETTEQVNGRGGIRAIAISHPHFYTTMIEWADRFDAQIFLHADDREWVMRKSSRIQFWEGPTLPLWDNLTLINCGGHFEGGTVLHFPQGANGKGALLTGDIIQVVQDRRYVSFMRSYPNLIPLGATAINHILEAIELFPFDQIYGAWWKANVLSNAKAAVADLPNVICGRLARDCRKRSHDVNLGRGSRVGCCSEANADGTPSPLCHTFS